MIVDTQPKATMRRRGSDRVRSVEGHRPRAGEATPGELDQLTPRQIDRFWYAVDKSAGADACWPWLKSSTIWGYGRIGFGPAGKQRTYNASRVALYLATKITGEVAMHSCDNRLCCNPAHLSWGSQADNIADCVKRGRLPSAPRTSKLTDAQAAEIRTRYMKGLGATLAREYGVSITIVHNILSGRTHNGRKPGRQRKVQP